MKKFLSLLVVLLTTFSSAWADDSGSCGTDLTWNYVESTKTLTITGTGAMTDFGVSNVPWSSYVSSITNVELHDGMTSIGNGAFFQCTALTSVTIPSTVQSIGNGAFFQCTALTSVTIPSTVQSIEDAAFSNCTALTSVTIPSTVQSIGNQAFYRCKALTSVTIPASVTSIGTSSFFGCEGLESITVESGNTMYDSRDNCNAIIEKSSNTLIAGCQNTVIPSTVQSIGSNAFFSCKALTSVTIPASVTSIGLQSFAGCSGLESITVESGNTMYDSRDNCNAIIEKSSNTLIAGCQNTVIPSTVQSIGNQAFLGCTTLTSVAIPSTVQSIGEQAFWNCTALTSVYNNAATPQDISSLNSNPFKNYANCTLYVPQESKSAYETANYWKDFKEIKGMVTTESGLTAGINAVAAGGTVTLDADIDLTSTIMVGKDFTLDLNGHVLNAGNLAQPQSNGDKASVIYIDYGRNLKITDSNPDATHTQEGLADVKGGVLTGGKGSKYQNYVWGGAIFSYGGNLTMTGGTICGNTANQCGGGIFNSGTSVISNVVITKNSSQQGGGVNNQASLTIENCSITQNTSTFIPGILQQSGTLTLKGKNIIKDNTYYGINCNIYLYNGAKVSLDGLTEGSEIGITPRAGQCQFTNICSAEDMQYFFSDNNSYALWYNTDHLETRSIYRADADLDTDFSVNDYNKVLNYILTPATVPAYPTKNILFLNADANADTKIDISDFTVIVEKIFNAAVSKAKALAPLATAESVDGLNVTVNGNVLTISADNASSFLAAQMDITLPEGITIVSAQSAGHTIYNKVQEDGSTRVLIAGLQNNEFAGNTVATITLSGNVESADVDNCVFTNSAFQSVAAKASSLTAVVNIDADVNVNNDGKYIENGKVVILKNGKKFSAAGQMIK